MGTATSVIFPHISEISAFSPSNLARLAVVDPGSLPIVSGSIRLGPPVGGFPKFIAIGLNYVDHAKEAGMPIPSEPIVFMKACNSLCWSNDDIEKPRGSTKLDWEVELANVIGSKAKYVSEEDAMPCVAGYALCNDISERDFQLERGGQWTKGKSHDTFGPLGPWLMTADSIRDVRPQDVARRQRKALSDRLDIHHDI
jgi:2-keto-4-pentenoate hydratase/2-oxohepta-3-ene-1,7-dioic acid hydratase in catechol pathway